MTKELTEVKKDLVLLDAALRKQRWNQEMTQGEWDDLITFVKGTHAKAKKAAEETRRRELVLSLVVFALAAAVVTLGLAW